jgi:hypothetical protein
LFSCNKHIVDDYPEESNCDKYAGKYLMYDPENDTSYEMIIECIPLNENYTQSLDTVSFFNYANRFNLAHNVDGAGDLDGTNIQPLTDKYGLRWNFSNNYFADYTNKINVLVKDSIYLWFTIDNTAYWQADGVSYQNITSVHSGVKIH